MASKNSSWLVERVVWAGLEKTMGGDEEDGERPHLSIAVIGVGFRVRRWCASRKATFLSCALSCGRSRTER